MKLGHVRLARKGEIPHFYATEDIRADEAVVEISRRALEDNAARRVIPPYFPSRFGEMERGILKDLPRRQSLIVQVREEFRKDRVQARSIVLGILITLMVAFAIGFFIGIVIWRWIVG